MLICCNNTIYTGPLSVKAQYSRLCPVSSSFRYNGSLFTWTVVCLTAAKFKPRIILSMSSFTLSNIANISTQPNYKFSLCSPGTDRTENISSIIACSLVAGETACPQNCSLATAVVLSPVYTAVTWQWDRAGWCGRKASDMHSGNPLFESVPEHRLSWQAFCDFPQSFQANAGIVPRLGYDRFLPDTFPVHSPYLSILYSLLVEALCNKPEGRGFDFRLDHWIFQ
jgi:hypothetical protein